MITKYKSYIKYIKFICDRPGNCELKQVRRVASLSAAAKGPGSVRRLLHAKLMMSELLIEAS